MDPDPRDASEGNAAGIIGGMKRAEAAAAATMLLAILKVQVRDQISEDGPG